LRPAHLIALVMALMLCGAAQLPGQSAVQEELGRIERLRKAYQDTGQKPLERARALEQIIAAYEELWGPNRKRRVRCGKYWMVK